LIIRKTWDKKKRTKTSGGGGKREAILAYPERTPTNAPGIPGWYNSVVGTAKKNGKEKEQWNRRGSD